ncbi:MAG: peptidyl-prolyl cis-trans isomerase [Sulfuriflexus sp.]|nr:peptidyl-prolyl cis-trans isomerase [Sulfuriflexus sp.]
MKTAIFRIKQTLLLLILVAIAPSSYAADLVKVRMQTSIGDIVLELDREKAPISVKNFLSYVESGAYEGTIFHRVIDNFMIQGGGFDEKYNRRPTQPPIVNEGGNGLKNLRGTIAMARTNAVHSATSQFFINLKDNSFLDHKNPTPRGFGYAVFGKVIDGMSTVDAMRKVETSSGGPFAKDAPRVKIVINKMIVE